MNIKNTRNIATGILILLTIFLPLADSINVKAQDTQPPYSAYLPFISLDTSPIIQDNYSLETYLGTVYGEVLNPGSDAILIKELPVYVVDANNQIIQTVIANNMNYFIIPKNSKACFVAYGISAPGGIKSIRFGPISYDHGYFGMIKNVVALNITASRPDITQYKLDGILRNDDVYSHSNITPVGTLYDTFGKVIECREGKTITTLLPTQQSPFSVTFYRYGAGFGDDNFPSVGSYKIDLIGN